MDEKSKSECSYTKEQISSTESLKANYGHSGSSNDVENLSFDYGSDDQLYENLTKRPAENSKYLDETFHNRDSIDEIKTHPFGIESDKNIGLFRKYLY